MLWKKLERSETSSRRGGWEVGKRPKYSPSPNPCPVQPKKKNDKFWQIKVREIIVSIRDYWYNKICQELLSFFLAANRSFLGFVFPDSTLEGIEDYSRDRLAKTNILAGDWFFCRTFLILHRHELT